MVPAVLLASRPPVAHLSAGLLGVNKMLSLLQFRIKLGKDYLALPGRISQLKAEMCGLPGVDVTRPAVVEVMKFSDEGVELLAKVSHTIKLVSNFIKIKQLHSTLP